tara:strand:+ start:42 stop:998 length:957 start_codon:yes stop_codon:yes gene_type:complete
MKKFVLLLIIPLIIFGQKEYIPQTQRDLNNKKSEGILWVFETLSEYKILDYEYELIKKIDLISYVFWDETQKKIKIKYGEEGALIEYEYQKITKEDDNNFKFWLYDSSYLILTEEFDNSINIFFYSGNEVTRFHNVINGNNSPSASANDNEVQEVNFLDKSYIGYIEKKVNFRSSPSTKSKVYSILSPGATVFINNLNKINGYFSVIEIETNIEGYIHSDYVNIGEEIKLNREKIFTATGKSNNYNPTVNIYNNTNKKMSLKLNNTVYKFSPKEKRDITIQPGTINYRASASNVIPSIGEQDFESYQNYKWEFFIVTK